MNGAVLGLSREEIDTRFNDIAAFADIGDFIEQPVKTYSSGMMVRLAFAVIAHVDADILIVDEALSVGDAFFTQKCMHFLRAFMENGTVLFVSHDHAPVKNLCGRAIWLNHGLLIENGNPENVCDHYFQYALQGTYGNKVKLNGMAGNRLKDTVATQKGKPEEPVIDYGVRAITKNNLAESSGWKTGIAEIISCSMEAAESGSVSEFEGGEKVRLILRAKAHMSFINPILGFIVKDRLGQELFGENTVPVTQGRQCPIGAGMKFSAEFTFRLPMLQNGQYVVMFSLAEGDTHNHVHHHYIHDAYVINVYSSKVRFGIVGVRFDRIALEIEGGQSLDHDEYPETAESRAE